MKEINKEYIFKSLDVAINESRIFDGKLGFACKTRAYTYINILLESGYTEFNLPMKVQKFICQGYQEAIDSIGEINDENE